MPFVNETISRIKENVDSDTRKTAVSGAWPALYPWLLLSLTLFGIQMVLEVTFRLTIIGPLFSIGFLHASLFALARSVIITGLIGLFPPKGRGWLFGTAVVFFPFIYSAQLVYFKFFRTFFILYSVGHGGQVMEFIVQILLKILYNLPLIVIILAPAVLYFTVFHKRFYKPVLERPPVRRKALLCIGCGVLLVGLSILSMVFNRSFNSPWQNYFHQNEILSGAHQFGVVTAMEVDARHFFAPRAVVKDELPLPEMTAPQGIPVPVPLPGPDPTQGQTTDPCQDPAPTASGGESPIVPDFSVPQALPIDFERRLQDYEFSGSDPLFSEMTREDQARYLDIVFSLTEPTHTNDHTARGQGFNLVFVTAESFSPYCIDPERTPTLYMMATQGIQFINYYNPIWSVSTLDGEYAGLCGMIPKPGVWSLMQSADNNMAFVPGNMFRRLGYNTCAWHDHTWTYYERDRSHPNLGYEYRGLGHGLDVTPSWPESDLEMMEKTVPEMIGQEPFHIYYLTVSGHAPYTRYGNAMTARHWDVYENRNLSNEARGYLACNYEVELAMKSLLDQLREAGIADRTLIVLNPDHYPYPLRHSTYGELAGHSLDETFDVYKSVLLFYHDGIEPEICDKYCCSLDILPTIYNYMGVPYDSRLLSGRDIFSESEGLVCLLGRSWITGAGRYDALNGTFERSADAALDVSEEEYIERVNFEVQLRFETAQMVLDSDYYRDLLSEDDWASVCEDYRDFMKQRFPEWAVPTE